VQPRQYPQHATQPRSRTAAVSVVPWNWKPRKDIMQPDMAPSTRAERVKLAVETITRTRQTLQVPVTSGTAPRPSAPKPARAREVIRRMTAPVETAAVAPAVSAALKERTTVDRAVTAQPRSTAQQHKDGEAPAVQSHLGVDRVTTHVEARGQEAPVSTPQEQQLAPVRSQHDVMRATLNAERAALAVGNTVHASGMGPAATPQPSYVEMRRLISSSAGRLNARIPGRGADQVSRLQHGQADHAAPQRARVAAPRDFATTMEPAVPERPQRPQNGDDNSARERYLAMRSRLRPDIAGNIVS